MDMGGQSTPSATTSAPARTGFNNADVSFLDMMYPHHSQAVDMARFVPSRSQNEQVRTLASGIMNAQAPEMQQISKLLQSFGKPAPVVGAQQMPGMPGMMSTEDMTALQGLSGKDFDRKWLQMMIDHHTGAITMANTELTSGANTDAIAFAKGIVAAQQTEIDQMRALLGSS
ncbi:DUF305 domain-containing protein [Nocardia sp. NBC_01388]|uniref:DUF305 domain-containing protein n=1 Tax=Nocardia sp. NBC_01388 TaxID=2903596 RepID=UPI00324636C5